MTAISFDQFKKRKQAEEQGSAIYGKLVWLNCPTCQRLEYTEVIAPSGRTHSCGTVVEELEIELDLRAEFTFVQFNLAKINELIDENGSNRLKKILARSLDKNLKALLASEQMYAGRLELAAGRKLTPYPGTPEELKEKLPLAEVNALGLWLSDFRLKPEDRFKV